MILKLSKEKFKQIFLSVIAICLIGLGYLNYGLNNIKEENTIEVSADYNEINLGDVQLVNSDIVPNEELENQSSISEKNDDLKNEGENDYFAETRLERDKMYSEMIEIYEKLIKSDDIPVEQRAIATQEITNITNTKNSIMIAENLIKNKGFEDAIILVSSDTVNIIVKSAKLNKEDISKIQNIVQRELNSDFSNISITNK